MVRDGVGDRRNGVLELCARESIEGHGRLSFPRVYHSCCRATILGESRIWVGLGDRGLIVRKEQVRRHNANNHGYANHGQD